MNIAESIKKDNITSNVDRDAEEDEGLVEQEEGVLTLEPSNLDLLNLVPT